MSVSYDQILEEACERKNSLRAFCTESFFAKTVTLEIGCGHGHFLTGYAQTYPERTFIGIDLCTQRIARSQKKQAHAMLGNLHFIKAEASEFIEAMPESVFLDQIFILFPDPWPKKRHHKNRLIQDNFLKLLAHKSLPEAKMYYRTDHELYFEWTKQKIEESKLWQLDSSDCLWPFEEESVFQKKMQSYQSLIANRSLILT